MTQDTGSADPHVDPTTNTDAPLATVTLGASEIASYLVALAGLLNGYLGRDYGLGANAQMISVLIAGLVVIGTTVARAIKHHAAMHANAAVYTAQVARAVTAVANVAQGALPPAAAAVPDITTTLDKAPSPPTVADPSGI